MAYNPYGAPPFGYPPAPYGRYPVPSGPPGMLPPPGLGPPPGMSAPGLAPPPGVAHQPSIAPANHASGLPVPFQPNHNIPNINFNAPIIRLGTSLATSAKAPGSGNYGHRKDEPGPATRPPHAGDTSTNYARPIVRDNQLSLPTKDELLRTIFVGGLTEGVGGSQGIAKLLGAAGTLRKWDKTIGADGKECMFGFAQFEDAESLAIALEIFKDINVPVKKQPPQPATPNDSAPLNPEPNKAVQSGNETANVDNDKAPISTDETAIEELAVGADGSKATAATTSKPDVAENGVDGASVDDEYPGIDKSRLIITADPATLSFLETYKQSRESEPIPTTKIEAAKVALKEAVRQLFYPPAVKEAKDADGDVVMGNTAVAPPPDADGLDVVNIPLAQEDELADIPAEMRETVAAEIAAFRERSHKSELERLRQEEEFEAAERERNGLSGASRPDTSNHAARQAPTGPKGSVASAPTAPRAHKVGFALSNGVGHHDDGEQDDTDASDEELWKREQKKKQAQEDEIFAEQERRWINRERSRAAALQRENAREMAEKEHELKNKETLATRLREWDDDREASRKSELYYRDRSAWIRERDAARKREMAQDDMDRRAEATERAREAAEKELAKDEADSFLQRQAAELRDRELASTPAPQPFKVKLKMHSAKHIPRKRTVAEVEGLLEDEEDRETVKRPLIPIKFESTILTDEENQEAVRALAQEIPSDKAGLWAWEVKWDHLDESTMEKLHPFIEKKIVEFLGVQEQLLVDIVEGSIRKKAKPAEVVEELGEALDEAEDLVRKVWRMLIFYTECDKRGLSA